jgi:hypothetical protein
LQVPELPLKASVVHAMPSLQLVGQLAGGSQVSPGSTTLLPQLAVQSASFEPLHPGGQQPSPFVQAMIVVWLHAKVHCAALPVLESVVHESPSAQLAGQLAGGSQVSPGSTTLLPHCERQSSSLLAVQPGAQQPSPLLQVTTGVWPQVALQFSALPVRKSVVQATASSQSVGQLAGGSQVSPGSTLPLPQEVEQSSSTMAAHPAGQQPSALTHETMGACVQPTLQVSAAPYMRSLVQAMASSQSVGQLSGGSQVSAPSSTPLPHSELVSTTPLMWSEGSFQPEREGSASLNQLITAAWHCSHATSSGWMPPGGAVWQATSHPACVPSMSVQSGTRTEEPPTRSGSIVAPWQ